jgi:hypothetical protein
MKTYTRFCAPQLGGDSLSGESPTSEFPHIHKSQGLIAANAPEFFATVGPTLPNLFIDENCEDRDCFRTLLNSWMKYFGRLLNIHGINDVRQIQILAPEPLVPDFFGYGSESFLNMEAICSSESFLISYLTIRFHTEKTTVSIYNAMRN